MNTKIIAAIVGVAILGGGYWYFTQEKMETAGTVPETTSDEMETSDLASVFKKGGSYECTIAMNTAQASSQGTVYVSGTDVRGEFTSVASGQTVQSSMIQTGGYVYTWSSMIPQGFKFKSTVDANPFASGALSSMNMPDGGSYKCKRWSADASKFVPPASVKFMEAPMQ